MMTTTLFDHETAQRKSDTFVAILEAVTVTPDIDLGDLIRLHRDSFQL